MEELRDLVGDYIQTLEKDKFLELLDTYKVMEKYADVWNDKWSPSSISNQQQLAHEFRRTGHNHWGSEIDLKALSEQLKTGLLFLVTFLKIYIVLDKSFHLENLNIIF